MELQQKFNLMQHLHLVNPSCNGARSSGARSSGAADLPRRVSGGEQTPEGELPRVNSLPRAREDFDTRCTGRSEISATQDGTAPTVLKLRGV